MMSIKKFFLLTQEIYTPAISHGKHAAKEILAYVKVQRNL